MPRKKEKNETRTRHHVSHVPVRLLQLTGWRIVGHPPPCLSSSARPVDGTPCVLCSVVAFPLETAAPNSMLYLVSRPASVHHGTHACAPPCRSWVNVALCCRGAERDVVYGADACPRDTGRHPYFCSKGARPSFPTPHKQLLVSRGARRPRNAAPSMSPGPQTWRLFVVQSTGRRHSQFIAARAPALKSCVVPALSRRSSPASAETHEASRCGSGHLNRARHEFYLQIDRADSRSRDAGPAARPGLVSPNRPLVGGPRGGVRPLRLLPSRMFQLFCNLGSTARSQDRLPGPRRGTSFGSKSHLKPQTREICTDITCTLRKFFGADPLCPIHVSSNTEYVILGHGL